MASKAQLNILIIDALLKTYGAPKLTDLIRKLPKMEREVVIEFEKGSNEASNIMLDVMKSFAELSDGKVKLEIRDRELGVPPAPTIRFVTGFEGRLRYYGLIDGILLCPLLESILYAGGVLKPPEVSLEVEECKVEIYVVPGRPCLETMRVFIPLALCSDKVEIEMIDARELEKQGGKLPAPFVPATVVNGRLVKVGSVKKVEDAVKLLTGG